MAGYVNCACRDCFEIAIAGADEECALCHECEAAGCSAGNDEECAAPHAYGDAEDDGGAPCET